MLGIAHIEEITDLVLHVRTLIQLQEARSNQFAPSVAAWLKSLEGSLAQARLPQSSLVAALRSNLIAAQHGQIPRDIELSGRQTRARIIAATAAHVLDGATGVASSVLIENQKRLDDATRIAYQIIAIATSKGAVPARDSYTNTNQYLSHVRSALEGIDECEPGLVHLDALVGPYDALVTLDRAMQPFLRATEG